MIRRTHRILAAGLMVIMLVAPVGAQKRVPVPAKIQLTLFRKIWTLDRTFPQESPVVVAIVYQRLYRESFVAKDDILKAGVTFDGLRFVVLDMDAAVLNPKLLEGIHVVYVAPLRALELSPLLTMTRARSIRTITGVPEYVLRGVAVGIAEQRNRPEILINRDAAEAEGADLSSQLLKLARVLR